jgi:DNA-binding transcriptional ArsR family regulator
METQTEPIKILDELTKNFDLKFFKTMSEPVRLEILKFLMVNGRSDIGTIAEHMPQDRSVISRHLNLLNFTEQVKQCVDQCCPSCCK